MIEHFLEYIVIERRYSLHTAEAYRKDLRDLCEFLNVEQSDFDPHLLTEDDLKAFLISRLDEGISPRSIRRYLSSFRSFWKYLLRIGHTGTDITARIIAPKIDKPLPVFFKEDEMQRATTREQVDDDFTSVRNTLIIELLYQTGMRRAELLGVKCSDVDFSLKQIRVLGKRNKERVIPLSDALLAQIQRYIDFRDSLPVQNNNGELLLNERGKPLSENALYLLVKERMAEVSTLKKLSPHVLRHTFATTMLDNGADINTIKTIMGHANLAATQVYTHTTFEQIKKEYKKAHPRAKK